MTTHPDRLYDLRHGLCAPGTPGACANCGRFFGLLLITCADGEKVCPPCYHEFHDPSGAPLSVDGPDTPEASDARP